MKICFVDTETTSLRHDRRAWEVGVIARLVEGSSLVQDVEHQWFVNADDLDLGNADLTSLRIGRYYDRHPQARTDKEFDYTDVADEEEVMAGVEVVTREALIVGAVPWFDTEVLGNRMRAHGILPAWHYHLVDIEALAAGKLGLVPPWDFDAILAAYGLAYKEADRHTALGDARLVRDLYDRVFAGGSDG